MDRSGRIRSLDGLRAVSVTMVVIAHLARHTGVFARFDLGNLGVRVFFVLSGFLITTLLAREHAATGRISLSAFYLRRTLRIFPPFYALVLAVAAARAAGVVALPWSDVAHAATYTMNYNTADRGWILGHTWSLAVEEQFYLLWPAALALAGFRRGLAVAALAMLAAPLVRVSTYLAFPAARAGIGETFPTVADALAVGCALALARDALWRLPLYRRFLGSPAFIAVPLVALMAHAGGKHPLFSFFVGTSLVNAAVALVVDRVVRFPDGPIGRFLDRRPVARVGVASYSIYLWQQPFLDARSNAWWTAFPQNLILVGLCAAASYHLIERPLLRLRLSLDSPRAPQKAPPARQAA
ncbi:acyltransferase family protein [Sorangium cellulosum]|uniref:acyltransferase family protein n=1 Tax=Sorangium cellulosum TaxID=56 RepID=UPI003D9A43FA